jgi:hypothetical protein
LIRNTINNYDTVETNPYATKNRTWFLAESRGAKFAGISSYESGGDALTRFADEFTTVECK